MDTFIEEEALWQELRTETEEVFRLRKTTDKIQQRVTRVRTFFSHMIERYSVISEEAARREREEEEKVSHMMFLWCRFLF